MSYEMTLSMLMVKSYSCKYIYYMMKKFIVGKEHEEEVILIVIVFLSME